MRENDLYGGELHTIIGYGGIVIAAFGETVDEFLARDRSRA